MNRMIAQIAPFIVCAQRIADDDAVCAARARAGCDIGADEACAAGDEIWFASACEQPSASDSAAQS